MSEIVIREAGPEDAADIAAIHEAAVTGELGRGQYSKAQIDAWAHARTLSRLRAQIQTRRFFIAEDPSGPLAYAQLDLDTAAVRSLYVVPTHRRRGLGRRLAQTTFAAANDAGLRRLELDSSLNAVAFYEALGFARIADVEHEFRSGICMSCVRMGRNLDGASGG